MPLLRHPPILLHSNVSLIPGIAIDGFMAVLGARIRAAGGRDEKRVEAQTDLGERLISPARFRAYCLIMELIGIDCRNVDTVSKQRSLPDPEICRTRYRGESLDISYCLVENPEGCEYAVCFGSSVFCSQPDRHNFEKKDRALMSVQ